MEAKLSSRNSSCVVNSDLDSSSWFTFGVFPWIDVGKLVGKPIKVDSNTSLGTRGKFAGICVEVDLSKPLLSQVRIGNFAQNIEYEGLHTVYFSCGCFGHRLESCSHQAAQKEQV